MSALPHPVVILHTNDFHGQLTEIGAQTIRSLKDTSAPALYLDAGDAVQCGNIGIPMSEERVWQRLATAKCDAVTMGNREFHVTKIGTRAKLRGAPCPVLCANIIDRSKAPAAPRFTSLLAGEIRVTVFGLTVPMITAKMRIAPLSPFLFQQPLECASQHLPELRSGCDLLIALTHIGLRRDRELAVAHPELDLIVGGHSHHLLREPEVVGGVPIVQAGSHGRFVGCVRVQTDRSLQGKLIPLREGLE